jgi:hypothetical protein
MKNTDPKNAALFGWEIGCGKGVIGELGLQGRGYSIEKIDRKMGI